LHTDPDAFVVRAVVGERQLVASDRPDLAGVAKPPFLLVACFARIPEHPYRSEPVIGRKLSAKYA
jgi:hypothetical protein